MVCISLLLLPFQARVDFRRQVCSGAWGALRVFCVWAGSLGRSTCSGAMGFVYLPVHSAQCPSAGPSVSQPRSLLFLL